MRVAMKLAVILGGCVTGAALAAQPPSLGMLTKLQRGLWQITLSDGAPARRICLGDPLQLVRLRHAGNAGCTRLVVEDEPGSVTVQYTCRGNGYGRTTIRRETDALAQIDSQGIAGGRPFQFRAEARRVGSCK